MIHKVKSRLVAVERAIAERQKTISALQSSGEPEAILQIASLKREVEILEGERKRLAEELQRIHEDYANRLPELERKYLAAVSKQKDLLRRIKQESEELVMLISELEQNIRELDLTFSLYREACHALNKAPIDQHVREIYHLRQAKRWLSNFLDWQRRRE